MLGKLDFKFLMLVATEGVGRDLKCVGLLKAFGDSSPSTTGLRVVNLRGFSMYAGNFSKVHETPLLAGLAGLNATSYIIGGLGGV